MYMSYMNYKTPLGAHILYIKLIYSAKRAKKSYWESFFNEIDLRDIFKFVMLYISIFFFIFYILYYIFWLNVF